MNVQIERDLFWHFLFSLDIFSLPTKYMNVYNKTFINIKKDNVTGWCVYIVSYNIDSQFFFVLLFHFSFFFIFVQQQIEKKIIIYTCVFLIWMWVCVYECVFFSFVSNVHERVFFGWYDIFVLVVIELIRQRK